MTDSYARVGLRVLALARREITELDIGKSREELENNMNFCGLLIC